MKKFSIVCIVSVFFLGCSTQEINIRFLEPGYAKEQLLRKSIRIIPPWSVEVLSVNRAFERMFNDKQGYCSYTAATLKSKLDTLRLYGPVTIDSTTAGGDYIVNVKYVKIAAAGSDYCAVGMGFEMYENANMKKVLEVEISDKESVSLIFTGSAIKAATNRVLRDFAEYLNKNL